MIKLKIENGKLKNKILTILSISMLAFGTTSCEQLQASLSSEQVKDQTEGIGELSAETTTFYFNGTSEKPNIKGDEAHLVLGLSQIAVGKNWYESDEATRTKNNYTLSSGITMNYSLSYTMNEIEYTSIGVGKATLGDSKTKLFLDLSPAVNLIDGTESPKYGKISYKVTVSGLVNASGNDYDGRSIPAFSKTIKFEPLYDEFIDDFITQTAPIGTTYKIPLNGQIVEVGETVEITANSNSTIPDGLVLKASKSKDGNSILLTTSGADISNTKFAGKVKISGIRAIGVKESYEHEFSVIFREKELPFKEFSKDGLGENLTWVINADDVKNLNIAKLSFNWTGDPGWITGVASEGDSDWGNSDTKLENITGKNKVLPALKDEWCAKFMNYVKTNGLKIAGGSTTPFSLTVKVYYEE